MSKKAPAFFHLSICPFRWMLSLRDCKKLAPGSVCECLFMYRQPLHSPKVLSLFLHQKTDGCFLTLVRKLPCCRGSLPSCPLASPSSLRCSCSCPHPVLHCQQRQAIHNILKTLKPQCSVDQNPVSFLLVEGSFVSWVQLLESTGLLV